MARNKRARRQIKLPLLAPIFEEKLKTCNKKFQELKEIHKLAAAPSDPKHELLDEFYDTVQLMRCVTRMSAHWRNSMEKSMESRSTGEELCYELVRRGLHDPRMNISYPDNPVYYEVKWHDKTPKRKGEYIPSTQREVESQLTYRMSSRETHFASRAQTAIGMYRYAEETEVLYLLNGPPASISNYSGNRTILPEPAFLDHENHISRPQSVQLMKRPMFELTQPTDWRLL